MYKFKLFQGQVIETNLLSKAILSIFISHIFSLSIALVNLLVHKI